jgi:nucleotide-binding universal stress UspA family protein
MQNILVPTDFSDNARKAVDFAAQLCQRIGASLHLIHSFILLDNVFIDRQGMRAAWNEQQKTEHTAALLKEQQYINERFPSIEVQTHLFSGPTDNVLLSYCERAHIELVIMGTQGASGIAEVLVGSVTSSFIGVSPIPVMAIPKDFNGQVPKFMVLAVRSFEYEPRKIDIVFSLAAFLDIPVKLIKFTDEDESDAYMEQEAHKLEDHAKKLKSFYPLTRVSSVLLEGDEFEETMQDFCNQNGIGILCMLTFHRSFWDKFFGLCADFGAGNSSRRCH